MDIVLSGWAGLAGSRLIYRDETLRARILARYREDFFNVFAPEADPVPLDLFSAEAPDYSADGARGGVLAALYRLLHARRIGGYFRLRDISIRQQTIEIAELFGLDPYRLYAPDTRVWLSGEGSPIETEELMARAKEAGVPCRVIGYTAEGPAIRQTDSERGATLRRPGDDELYRVIKRIDIGG